MKKYQKIFAFLIVFMFIGTSWFYYDNYVKGSGIVKVSARENLKSNSSISMMYETKYQSGEYIETEDNSWPLDGYKFNETLSKCENESNISWDDTNNKILVSAVKSDKCYVYFDALPIYFANYIKNLYTTDGANSLYFHDADLTNGANDGSYRYAGKDYSIASEYKDSYIKVKDELITRYCDAESSFVSFDGYCSSGNAVHLNYKEFDYNNLFPGVGDALKQAITDGYISEEVNNFVCFASDAESCPEDSLYRIIGVFGDQVKLIKYDYATSEQLGTNGECGHYNYGYDFYYLSSNYRTNDSCFWVLYNDGLSTWTDTELNTINLNTNYINYLNNRSTKWVNMISETTWQVGGNTKNNILNVNASISYQNELVNPAVNITYTDEIGLMYVSDYIYASSPSNWGNPVSNFNYYLEDSWLTMGLDEWIITPVYDSENNQVFMIDYKGDIYTLILKSIYSSDVFGNVRPTFYLKSSVIYSGVGDGSKKSPYRLALIEE